MLITIQRIYWRMPMNFSQQVTQNRLAQMTAQSHQGTKPNIQTDRI